MGWWIGVVDPSTQCSKQIGAVDPTIQWAGIQVPWNLLQWAGG